MDGKVLHLFLYQIGLDQVESFVHNSERKQVNKPTPPDSLNATADTSQNFLYNF